MKQVFDDADRAKKKARVTARSAAGAPEEVTEAIKASLADGYLPCEAAFEIARNLKVPLVAVGNAADDLGIRVTSCQLGCFKVKKAVHDLATKTVRPEVSRAVEEEIGKSALTCAGVFGMAKRLGVPPVEVADAANVAHIKIHGCQLGCF